MARLARLCAVAVGLCGLYGRLLTEAVLTGTPSKNGSSSIVARSHSSSRDVLETSQSRIDRVKGFHQSSNGGGGGGGGGDHDRSSNDQVSAKDYGNGDGYPAPYYGPTKDYYYDERPEYYRPPQAGGHHPQFEPPDVIYHQHPHKGHHNGEVNIQPLLWPLAGITLLGVLSALVKTPLLLNLGTLGNYRRRRRRRRDVYGGSAAIAAETIRSLLQNNKFDDETRQGISTRACWVCDVVTNIHNQKSTCVERTVCEVMSQNKSGEVEEVKRLLTSTIARVVEKEKIPEDFKKRLESAESSGRNGGKCGQLYPCEMVRE